MTFFFEHEIKYSKFNNVSDEEASIGASINGIPLNAGDAKHIEQSSINNTNFTVFQDHEEYDITYNAKATSEVIAAWEKCVAGNSGGIIVRFSPWEGDYSGKEVLLSIQYIQGTLTPGITQSDAVETADAIEDIPKDVSVSDPTNCLRKGHIFHVGDACFINLRVPSRLSHFPLRLSYAAAADDKGKQGSIAAYLNSRPVLKFSPTKLWPEKLMASNSGDCVSNASTACAFACAYGTCGNPQREIIVQKHADPGYVFLSRTIKTNPDRTRYDNTNSGCEVNLAPSVGDTVIIRAVAGTVTGDYNTIHAITCNAQATEVKSYWSD